MANARKKSIDRTALTGGCVATSTKLYENLDETAYRWEEDIRDRAHRSDESRVPPTSAPSRVDTGSDIDHLLPYDVEMLDAT
mmetsp:Transcript_28328/g.59041  ORF Transcript_28328/g.59041 Transcript_28328/m.59041 type:complete len:82 (+) Transcript_28328:1416-1661(+)